MRDWPLIVVKDDSVRIHDLHPAVFHALYTYRDVRVRYGLYDDVVVTSGSEEGTYHSFNSRHWSADAIDARSRDLPRELLTTVERDLKAALGRDFDVIFEALNTPNEHLHIERDPKRRA